MNNVSGEGAMKRKFLLSIVAVTGVLISLVSLHKRSPTDVLEASGDTASTQASVEKRPFAIIDVVKTPNEPIVQNRLNTDVEGDPLSQLPEDVRKLIEFERLYPKSKRFEGMIESSKKSAAERKKYLEEIGLGETFEYLHRYVNDYQAYYNADVVGETPDQKKAVRERLRESLAITLTSFGLNQTRVEELEALNYSVIEGAERAMSLDGELKDLIALSEDVKFGLRDNGTECLFFSSSNLKRFQEKAFGAPGPYTGPYGSTFSPYCVYHNHFESSTPVISDRSYDKKELEDLIKEFHD